jgi:hypothetical protein
VRATYLATVFALRRRELPTFDVSSRVRVTKTYDDYLAVRDTRRELTYEALIASGRTAWSLGERVRVYRTTGGSGGVVPDPDDEAVVLAGSGVDLRDYDAEHYVRVLQNNFASRLERALTPDDFSAVFADPEQPSLFDRNLDEIRPILTSIPH